MIYVLLTPEHDYTITQYLASGGRPQAEFLRAVPWKGALRKSRLPVGTYVLTDFERLSRAQLRRATALADALTAHPRMRLLNHPARWQGRYDLLRQLHADGTNPFGVHRLRPLPAPVRYPVFLRIASDHQGARSALLSSPAEVQAAATALRRRGKALDDVIVVEFQDTADAHGQFRKYSAFRVGDRIVPRHLFFGSAWCLKAPSNHTDAHFDEEAAYLRDNPHEAELRRIFDIAGVDFGRIDYALSGNRVCVWEINTNPMISIPEDATTGRPGAMHAQFHEAFAAALRAIDTPAGGEVEVPRTPAGLLARLRGR